MTDTEPHKELDSRTLPELSLLGARYKHTKDNRKQKKPDILLGCKAFWETFQRSRLVIILDRHADDMLLRRILQELEGKPARTMQTLVVFIGTVNVEPTIVADIRAMLKETKSLLDFHFLPGMRSDIAPFPHDRFAVTDAEFWHFGGSVAGHEGLTGVSRGWKALDIGVEDFVMETWEALAKEAQR